MPERCSSPVPKSYPFREPGMCLIHVYTFRAHHWRTLPCLFLTHGLTMQEHACDARPSAQHSVAEEGGRNTGQTWTEDGQRRQAGPFVGLHRLSTYPPGRSAVVSHLRDICVPCSEYRAGMVVLR